MSGLAMRVTLQNMALPSEVLKRLSRLNTQPMMDEIGDFVLSETLHNFDQEQTPEGEDWKPSQRARSKGGKTLQDTGRLRDSYVYDAQRDQVEIGSNTIYSAIHHFGGKTGRNQAVTMPARPALGINDDIESEIGDIVVDFYRRAAA